MNVFLINVMESFLKPIVFTKFNYQEVLQIFAVILNKSNVTNARNFLYGRQTIAFEKMSPLSRTLLRMQIIYPKCDKQHKSSSLSWKRP